MYELFVFTFSDGSGNKIEITAPSKTKAKEQAKRVNMGGGVLRCVDQRPATVEEVARSRKASKERAEREKQTAATTPRIIRRRKAFGRNDRCPCGSGKKVKHCRCQEKNHAIPKQEAKGS